MASDGSVRRCSVISRSVCPSLSFRYLMIFFSHRFIVFYHINLRVACVAVSDQERSSVGLKYCLHLRSTTRVGLTRHT